MHLLPSNGRYMDLIGYTPLVSLQLKKDWPKIWCKLEFLNPSGSTKDRIARYILKKAWRQQKIDSKTHVFEASSGSTATSIAMMCAQLNMQFTAVMPEGCSLEKKALIEYFGGKIIEIPQQEGMHSAILVAKELAEKTKGFFVGQFQNPDNPEAHRQLTGQEILTQIRGEVIDAVAVGVGTGGTLIGLTELFRYVGCQVRPFQAFPIEYGNFCPMIPGIVDDMSILMEQNPPKGLTRINITKKEALKTTSQLHHLGFPVGPSSGLNYAAALAAYEELDIKDPQVVTVFCDRMERYISEGFF